MKLNDGFELLATAPEGVARLRELILSLAVQGRLVPQDSRDEPATTLLQRVRHEKDSLIADGQVKRDKPMQHIGHVDAPFAVPVGWVWTRFGAVVMDSEAGWSPSCETVPRTTGQWGVLKVSAVSWGKFRPEENKGLPGELVPRPKYEVRRGDFLLSRANTEELVARSVIVETDEPALMMSDKIIRLRLSGLCEPQYLNLFNNGEDARRHYIKHASGTSSSMKNVSRDVILNLPIPLPPAAEQARIVAKVNELMGICDELEEQGRLEAEQHARLTATLLEALAASKSPHALAENWSRVAAHFDLLLDRPEAVDALDKIVLQLAVRGLLVPQDANDEPASELLQKIRLQKDRLIAEGKIKRDKPTEPIADDEKPFEVPPGWTWARMPQVAESRLGKMLDKAKNTGALFPYLRNTNVQWNRFELDDIKTIQLEDYELDEYRLRSGDLMICEGGEPGRCAIWREESSDMYFQKALHRVRALGGVSPEFLALCFESDANSLRLEQYFTGATIKHFAGQELSRYCLPLPPVAEQVRIVARVGELRFLCAALRERLTARQSCQARFAEDMVERAASAAPLVAHTDNLAAAA